MSQVYVHNRKYRSYSRRLMALTGICALLAIGTISSKLYFRYNAMAQDSQTQISNNETALTGYISPYFMFKDSAKWIQDKADSTPNMIVYNQYVNGEPGRQLVIYMNQTPNTAVLASTRVLTVKNAGTDGLSAENLSGPCSDLMPSGQKAAQEVTISGVAMFCDPSTEDYSVIFETVGGSYQLKLSTAKNTNNFIVLYRDGTGHPDSNDVINIANSFKAI